MSIMIMLRSLRLENKKTERQINDRSQGKHLMVAWIFATLQYISQRAKRGKRPVSSTDKRFLMRIQNPGNL